MIHPRKLTGGKARASLMIVVAMASIGLAVATSPAPAPKSISVGDFAVLIASRLASTGTSRAPLTAESAATALQAAGVKIPKDLGAPMTEADAVEIFRQFNISLAPQDGARLLDPSRASSLVGIFASTLSARSASQAGRTDSSGGTGESATNASQGLLESIADCQALPKTQDCQQCCRDLLGGNSNDPHTNRTCAKACNTKARNVSPSEPTP
jgi:hypothetical protein